MFPHPDIGKDLHRPWIDAEHSRCRWQATIALAIVMVGAMLSDVATRRDTPSVAAVTQEGGR